LLLNSINTTVRDCISTPSNTRLLRCAISVMYKIVFIFFFTIHNLLIFLHLFSHLRVPLFKYCPILFICVLFVQFIIFLYNIPSFMLSNFT
jgi:hypothetical protein